MGPFRSGKSSASVIELVRRAMAQRPGSDGIRRTRWVVARNTRSELLDTTIKTVHMWLPPSRFGDFNKTSLNYTIKAIDGCEIEIWFRALDKPDDIKHLLSLECTGAWFNEGREIPWSIVHAMQGRVLQYPSKAMGGCTWGGIWLDSNPPDTTSQWYKFFEEGSHDRGYAEIFKQPSGLSAEAENLPFINGGRKYYENLAIDKGEDWVKVYIKGEYGFTKEGKAIFPEFSDSLHVKEMDPAPGIPIHRGFDWGLTPSCIFSQLLPDQRWNVFDELTSTDMSVENFLDIVKDHSLQSFKRKPDFIDTGDPAGAQRSQVDARTVFQVAAAKGFDMAAGYQALNLRIESVRRPLRRIVNGKPQFVLHPRCTVLRKGFLGGYHYRRMSVKGERYTPEPHKNEYSHPMDALQYSATRIFAPMILAGIDGQAPPPTKDSYETDDVSRSDTGY